MHRAAFGLPATTLLLTVISASPALAEPPAPPSTAIARTELAALTVAAPHSMDGYARDKFDIWSTQPNGCTTRQAVLARDGKDVQDKPDGCQPASGSWYSAYDDTTVTDVAQATIDHMVPLAEAWRSGADTWTADQRKAFGNDLKDPQLLIASESANSSKSDSGPADWKPTNQAFWCTYAKDYTHIKAVWKLTTTDQEKTALSSMLDTCTN
ncbi:HNH endonuclease family protein [Streptomyces sp. HUAS TT20]|uniref:HNH endonuclease family protein n=1 Tax=Streptomyces sp. HUAS TT20 TaxID=3447509 RepID=UPI0021DA25E3|nr:HNH endonuclease family protein [Streptomyces sp. HUAS 15-9]UXY25143.1 HNH endonuclease family protein [Streptomyces sp. HUAS 15-9]